MNLQPQIKKVFDIINALPSMQIFASIEELDEYLDAIQKKATRGASPSKYFQSRRSRRKSLREGSSPPSKIGYISL
ncbi:MAG: hypothetical protein PVI06_06895 [Desulfobacterales bacterium]|jgi:hypothetical protein